MDRGPEDVILESRGEVEVVAGQGCPSCGAERTCADWLKITLGFTAAKTIRRFLITHGVQYWDICLK
jgi:hypothetical protein